MNNSSENISEKLCGLIHDRALKPGDKLPNEYELSSLLNVSRSTLREAIKSLAGRSILNVRRGVGTFVAEMPGFVDDPWGVGFFQSDIETARQLLDIRLFIEPELAALAAENAVPSDLEAITAAHTDTENAIFSGKAHTDEDTRFHIAIAEASHNAIALSIMKQVFFQSIPKQARLSNNSLLRETIATHSEISESIVSGNAQAAKEAMLKHLEFNKAYITGLLEKENQKLKSEKEKS